MQSLKKIVSFILISSLFLVINTGTGISKAQTQVPSFEEQSRKAGYKTVIEAIKEFEGHCKCEVILPTMLPSIPFTHQFGRTYIDKEGGKNDSLEIRFLNRKERDTVFKIDIRLDIIDFKKDFEGKEYTLEDGNKGFYFENHLFNFFVFEKGELQYLLGISKKVKNMEPQKVLLEIANSVK